MGFWKAVGRAFANDWNRQQRRWSDQAQAKVNGPRIKTYHSAIDFERDAVKMEATGYKSTHVMHEGKQVSASRTFTRAVLTGGAGLLIGGRVYKGGDIVVTWHKG